MQHDSTHSAVESNVLQLMDLQVRNITNEGDNAAEALQALLEQQELSVESVVMEETSKPGGGKQLSAVVRLTPPPLPWLQGPDEPAPSPDAGGTEGDITKVSFIWVLQHARFCCLFHVWL